MPSDYAYYVPSFEEQRSEYAEVVGVDKAGSARLATNSDQLFDLKARVVHIPMQF